MKIHRRSAGVVASLLITCAIAQPLHAELPMAKDAPELGYFAYLAEKNYKFGIDTVGEIQCQPLDRKGDATGEPLKIQAGIVETGPDGSHQMRVLDAKSLQTDEAPAAVLTKTRYRGKADNDAVMEAAFEASRGVVFLGGRILDKGTGTSPQHVGFSIRLDEVNKGDNQRIQEIEDEKEKEKAQKDFAKKIRNDSISLRLAGGKRLKQKLLEPIEALNEQVKGAVIEQVELEYAAYPGHKFLFTASPGSAISLEANKGVPLHTTLSIHWKSNPEKDPEGKARLALQVK